MKPLDERHIRELLDHPREVTPPADLLARLQEDIPDPLPQAPPVEGGASGQEGSRQRRVPMAWRRWQLAASLVALIGVSGMTWMLTRGTLAPSAVPAAFEMAQDQGAPAIESTAESTAEPTDEASARQRTNAATATGPREQVSATEPSALTDTQPPRGEASRREAKRQPDASSDLRLRRQAPPPETLAVPTAPTLTVPPESSTDRAAAAPSTSAPQVVTPQISKPQVAEPDAQGSLPDTASPDTALAEERAAARRSDSPAAQRERARTDRAATAGSSFKGLEMSAAPSMAEGQRVPAAEAASPRMLSLTGAETEMANASVENLRRSLLAGRWPSPQDVQIDEMLQGFIGASARRENLAPGDEIALDVQAVQSFPGDAPVAWLYLDLQVPPVDGSEPGAGGRDVRWEVTFDPRWVRNHQSLGGRPSASGAVVALYELEWQEPPVADEVVATIRVSYLSVAGQRELSERWVRGRDVVAGWELGPPQVRLASLVARFGEGLLQGPQTAQTDFNGLVRELTPLVEDPGAPADAATWLRLVERAAALQEAAEP